MSKGISIHIGLNAIDPAHYGTTGALAGCENDAKAMSKIANSLGYETRMLLTKEATSSRVLAELYHASQQLSKGDVLMLTYAGHGTQVNDVNEEEQDRKDETWCLYDRMLLDDELYNTWSNFRSGVRIVVISDSCHSGTVTREIFAMDELKKNYPSGTVFRCLDPRIADDAFEKHKYWYCGIKYGISRDIAKQIEATVLLISGCQDNQLSGDGPDNGLFTSKLLKVWNSAKFKGSYSLFHEQICSLMPPVQTPNYLIVGAANSEFESQTPFVVNAARIIDGDEVLKLQRPRMLNWSLDVEERSLEGMNNEQIKMYLNNMVEVALMPAYQKFRMMESQIILPRGGEIHGGCQVGDKGWSCGVGGSIRF